MEALAHVRGSSEMAGSKSPLHVLIVGPDGNSQPYAITSFWTVTHRPAGNTQATATKASAGAATRNVCTGLTVTLIAGASAPSAVNVAVSLIDGASGGGTYLWGTTLGIPAVAGATNGVSPPNGPWVGSAATAMTLEFGAAGGSNTVESVTMSGFTVAAA